MAPLDRGGGTAGALYLLGDVRRLPQPGDRAAQRTVRLNAIVAALFARGHAADIILAVMAVEAVWLASRGGWRVGDVFCRIAPGALMVLALRAAMTGAGWPWIAAPLILSFPPHLADLRRRGGGQDQELDLR